MMIVKPAWWLVGLQSIAHTVRNQLDGPAHARGYVKYEEEIENMSI